jgi:hypothetical protein
MTRVDRPKGGAALDHVGAKSWKTRAGPSGPWWYSGIDEVTDAIRLDHGTHHCLGEPWTPELDREDIPTARTQDPTDLAQREPRVGHVLHHMAADHEVERLVWKRQPLEVLHRGSSVPPPASPPGPTDDLTQRRVRDIGGLEVVR